MESLFKEILSHQDDPRKQVLEVKKPLIDWSLSKELYLDEGYNRNVVFKTDDLNEIVLACWKKGHITPFHNHPGQSCWIYLLKGELEETLVKSQKGFILKEGLRDWDAFKQEYSNDNLWPSLSKSKQITVVGAGSWNYIDDQIGFHRMYAKSDEVLSLHIYRKLDI